MEKELRKINDLERKQVDKSLPDFYYKENTKEVLQDFENIVYQSMELSENAGKHFQKLFHKSLKQPEKEYIPDEYQPESVFHLELKNAPYKLKTTAAMFGVEKMKENLAEQYQGKSGILDERMEGNGRLYQKYKRVFKQGDGQNLISEKLENYVFPTFNKCSSELALIDTKNGFFLDLQKLLPEHYYFRPSEMKKTKIFKDVDGEFKEILVPVQLQEYINKLQSELGNDKFSAGNFGNSKGGVVEYSNLAKDGEILSLLHEIAHTWQDTYYEEYGRYPFEKLFRDVSLNLWLLSGVKRRLEKEPDADEEKTELEKLKQEIADLGVEYDFDTFDKPRDKEELKDDEFGLYDSVMKENFVIKKSEALKKHIKDYQDQERGAWSMALKMLRYLREQGFDVEPSIHSSKMTKDEIGNIPFGDLNKEIKDKVHYCLNSYQNKIQEVVQSKSNEKGKNKDVQFVKY